MNLCERFQHLPHGRHSDGRGRPRRKPARFGSSRRTKGWFIPRDKDGRRIARAAIKSSGGHGGGENGFYAESENTWTLDERPAEIVYEYPVGFEKRELAFHLKGLTLPKPKPKADPKAPEKP